MRETRFAWTMRQRSRKRDVGPSAVRPASLLRLAPIHRNREARRGGTGTGFRE